MAEARTPNLVLIASDGLSTGPALDGLSITVTDDIALLRLAGPISVETLEQLFEAAIWTVKVRGCRAATWVAERPSPSRS